MACLECLVFLFKIFQDVAHAETYALCLVAVGGAYALAGGAHLVLSLGGLVGTVEHTVGGQDEMGAAADVQAVGQRITGGFEFFGLGHEEVGGNDAAVADDVDFPFVEDARRNGAQHEFLSFKDNGVSGVGTARKTGHHIVARSKVVDYLTFAFIAKYDAQQGINFSFCHYRNGY